MKSFSQESFVDTNLNILTVVRLQPHSSALPIHTKSRPLTPLPGPSFRITTVKNRAWWRILELVACVSWSHRLPLATPSQLWGYERSNNCVHLHDVYSQKISPKFSAEVLSGHKIVITTNLINHKFRSESSLMWYYLGIWSSTFLLRSDSSDKNMFSLSDHTYTYQIKINSLGSIQPSCHIGAALFIHIIYLVLPGLTITQVAFGFNIYLICRL